jgi:antitoxin PrlF
MKTTRSQAYFWTNRWQAGEQAAQKDIESGQTTRFDDIDDALEFLDCSEQSRLDHDDCLENP